MSKKIFIITGETSGDRIASLVINKIKKKYKNTKFLAIGGNNIRSENVDCIFDIKEISYMGFVDVIKNIFALKNRLNFAVKKISEFKPDIIFSVDCPDFSFRILKKIKKIDKINKELLKENTSLINEINILEKKLA